MGPEATVELFRRILSLTPAGRDQDYLHVLIDSNPKIPDRTAAIIGEGESPLPALIAAAQNLERAGADFIAIPCNTAHYWLHELREEVSIPIIDMIGETASRIADQQPALHKIGLLATTGTLQSGLYQRAFAEGNIDLIVPSEEQDAVIMSAIHAIKAGDHSVKSAVIEVAQELMVRGAQGIIPGCTELSLVVPAGSVSVPVFDPLSILAERAVSLARRR
jgi:aspartate racemase